MRGRRHRYNRGIGMMAIYIGLSVISLALFIVPKLLKKKEDSASAPTTNYLQEASPTIGSIPYAGTQDTDLARELPAAAPKAPTMVQPSNNVVSTTKDYRYTYEQAMKVLTDANSTQAQRKAAHAAVVQRYGDMQAARR